MSVLLAAAVAAAGLALLPASAARAAAFKSVNECTPGRHVAGSDHAPGRVVKITQGTMCEVTLDGSGDTHYYIFWMLHDAGGSAETDDRLVAGKYECFSFSSGHANYDFMDIIVTSATTYRSGGATYSMSVNPQTRAIVFRNGPFAGRPAKLIDGPSIQFSATTCQLAK